MFGEVLKVLILKCFRGEPLLDCEEDASPGDFRTKMKKKHPMGMVFFHEISGRFQELV